jgi:hypothetical protein
MKTAAMVMFLLLCFVTVAGAQDMTIEFHNGRVSMTARSVSIRVILSEWARVGGTSVVNGDLVPDTLVVLDADNVPEADVIGALLHGVRGYVATRRASPAPGASQFERISILADSTVSSLDRVRPLASEMTASLLGKLVEIVGLPRNLSK